MAPLPEFALSPPSLFDIVPTAMPLDSSNDRKSVHAPLTGNQIRGFWAAWGGWTLDGMDSFIYALVLFPSLRELLPRSGIAATKANVGYYGGLLFALFLLGWGLAFLWGPVGDKFGRVRTLMLTIVWYSVFTFLSALVTSAPTDSLSSSLRSTVISFFHEIHCCHCFVARPTASSFAKHHSPKRIFRLFGG